MARYDYKCSTCGKVEDRYVPYEARLHPQACGCGGFQHYQFPLSAARGFQPFSEYHDEVLGIDVHGRREKREALRARGLEEAGDKVGGARFEERSSLASRIVPLPPRGVSLADLQRRSALESRAAEELVVGVEGRDKVRVKDLPAPKPAKKVDVTALAKKAAAQIAAIKD